MKFVTDFSVTARPPRPARLPVWDLPWRAPLSATAPGLILDFAADQYGAGGAKSALSGISVFHRASPATAFDAAGGLATAGIDTLRQDHDPFTGARNGIVVERAGTNLISGSDLPVDQTVAVTATPHVISFFGTGTVTLSGAYSATVAGLGAFPTRTEFAFTPTAGNLSLGLSGNVSYLQLEEANVASSYISSPTGPTNRADDNLSVPLGPWFSSAAGTLVFGGVMQDAVANDRVLEIDDGTSANRISLLWNTVLDKPQLQTWSGGVLQAAVAPAGSAIGLGNHFRAAIAYSANDFAISVNGGTLALDTSGSLPASLSTIRVGRSAGGAQGLLTAETVVYYPSRLPDAELQALSA